MDSWMDDEIELFDEDELIDFDELRSQLFDVYQQQSPFRKSIVQLLSVFYAPATIANLVTALNQIGITTKTGKKITPSNLRPQITALIEEQLVIHGAGHLPQCHLLIVEMVTRDAVKSNIFDPMFKAVRNIFHPRRHYTGNRIRLIYRSKDELYREARLALYGQDHDTLPQLFLDYGNYNYYAVPVDIHTAIGLLLLGAFHVPPLDFGFLLQTLDPCHSCNQMMRIGRG